MDDDESSRFDRWASFFRNLGGMSAACVLRFGDPIDPFGNPVDDEGRSLGPAGRPVDAASYVSSRGEPRLDPVRDAAYTRELGQLLVDRYRRETVLMSTQLVAHVLYRALVAATPGLDLFDRVRVRGELTVPRDELVRQVGVARDALLSLAAEGRVHVSPVVARERPDDLVARALRSWHGYHLRDAARAREAEVVAEEPTLLYYYGNRLAPFAEHLAEPDTEAAAREIAAPELHA
jgi:glycerol-3-phosphate O-acyltransferase